MMLDSPGNAKLNFGEMRICYGGTWIVDCNGVFFNLKKDDVRSWVKIKDVELVDFIHKEENPNWAVVIKLGWSNVTKFHIGLLNKVGIQRYNFRLNGLYLWRFVPFLEYRSLIL